MGGDTVGGGDNAYLVCNTGEDMDTFVQLDKDGEFIHSLSKPSIQIGEYVLLQATEVSKHGTFIDLELPIEFSNN